MRYLSSDEDSGRWDGFPFRDGDIVISTRSKSGTTWMQMICALLIFRSPDLPAPLSALSPWLDWLIVPRAEVYSRLEAQRHRRFIKTHTPLDGIPLDPRATYIVVARHPLDMAVSLFHQGANLNRERLAELTGRPAPAAGQNRSPGGHEAVADGWVSGGDRGAVAESLRRWIDRDASPAAEMDSVPGVLWHLSDAWRRRLQPNVLLVHYADLSKDLAAEMTRIAARLHLDPPTDDLVDAAGFDRMRGRATELAPDPAGILKSADAFFRRGGSGAGRDLLTDAEFARYLRRAARMAPPDLLEWLHR
ncbi:MAG TPA: sulfotransferase domain-containing protein [Actinoplanes sp.]|nr:sulfotransferase domain-containing protein [Actinoplanes sp.]